MKRKLRWLHVLLLCSLFLASPALASGPPAALSARIGAVEVDAFPQVRAAVTVRDANGVPVTDLAAEAFEINEDRAAQARLILAVEQAVNPAIPVGLVLVMDISGSMAGQPMTDARTAALALLDALGDDDQVAFLAFADAVDLDALDPAREQPFTRDPDAVAALVEGLGAAGGTPLYDALYKGVGWAEGATLGHRAVILFTDGVDEGPGSRVASAETPIQAATRANVPVFTIGLGTQIDRGYLERVARTTGGFYQETPDSSDLTRLFLNVLDRLKHEYVLTYDSGLPGDGAMHRVQLAVRVGDRQASDEAEFGPVPLLATPTPEPTASPTAPPPPTAVPPATPTPTAAPAVAEEDDVGPDDTAQGPGIGSLLAGLAALLLAGGILVVLRGRRRAGAAAQAAEQLFCLSCGRALAPDQVCPDCGPDAGQFRKPQR